MLNSFVLRNIDFRGKYSWGWESRGWYIRIALDLHRCQSVPWQRWYLVVVVMWPRTKREVVGHSLRAHRKREARLRGVEHLLGVVDEVIIERELHAWGMNCSFCR